MRSGGDLMTELVDIIPVHNRLGEGVTWDTEIQCLWWTDIHAKRLFRYDPSLRSIDTFQTPERLGSFGLVAGSTKMIAAFESGVGFHQPGTDDIEWLARPRFDTPGLRFNDGRVDRQGRFWAGTMVEGQPDVPAAALYSIGPDGTADVHATGISISNGICWSPDSTRFYFADSPLRTIFAYEFDSLTGQISNRRVFAHTPEGAYPDGANVDAEGYLWSAHWGGGRVVRYAPDGTIDSAIEMPVSLPTCVAFGGANLDLLFVTSATDSLSADSLSQQPSAGAVFVYKVTVPGLSDGRYNFEKTGS
jgi:sugar lactone lactonase YvrE